MMLASIPQLQRALETLSVPGILVDHRIISDGDEKALLPEELDAFAGSVIKVRRASGSARILARTLLRRLGLQHQAIVKSASGLPVWPYGMVGSLAHDSEIAVAAIAMRRHFSSVGIDIEPADPLDSALLAMVATSREREQASDEPCRGRLLFCIKEAVYKASYPLDGTFLDHHDVEVDFGTGTAAICSGRLLNFRYCISDHIVALAFIAAPQSREQA
jgi:4'-phosphopantetheinyl transferase EntD